MKNISPLYVALLIADFTMALGIRFIQIDNALENELEEEEEEKRSCYEKK